jgi:hypothetical protein
MSGRQLWGGPKAKKEIDKIKGKWEREVKQKNM